jgi:hypothetical protein
MDADGRVMPGLGTEWSRLQATYLRRLRGMTSEHAEVIVPAVKAAFDEQTERADHLDSKGDRIVAASVAALGAFAALAKTASLNHPQAFGSGPGWKLMLAGIVALFLAAIAGLAGLFITRGWFGSTPGAFIDDGIIRKDDVTYLQLHLALHYLDCFERNAAAADRKATAIQVAQVLLVIGVFLMACAALMEMSA